MIATDDDEAIRAEKAIVWLEPPEGHGYLREAVLTDFSSRSRPRIGARFRLVGYATVRRKRPGELHRRRYWWLKPNDRSLDPDGAYATGHPAEAVDPSSIRVGLPSVRP